jgi:hypothetical protein
MIGVALKQAFLDGLAEATGALPPQANAHRVMGSRKEADILQQGKARMREEVVRRIRLLLPTLSPGPSPREGEGYFQSREMMPMEIRCPPSLLALSAARILTSE